MIFSNDLFEDNQIMPELNCEKQKSGLNRDMDDDEQKERKNHQIADLESQLYEASIKLGQYIITIQNYEKSLNDKDLELEEKQTMINELKTKLIESFNDESKLNLTKSSESSDKLNPGSIITNSEVIILKNYIKILYQILKNKEGIVDDSIIEKLKLNENLKVDDFIDILSVFVDYLVFCLNQNDFDGLEAIFSEKNRRTFINELVYDLNLIISKLTRFSEFSIDRDQKLNTHWQIEQVLLRQILNLASFCISNNEMILFMKQLYIVNTKDDETADFYMKIKDYLITGELKLLIFDQASFENYNFIIQLLQTTNSLDGQHESNSEYRSKQLNTLKLFIENSGNHSFIESVLQFNNLHPNDYLVKNSPTCIKIDTTNDNYNYSLSRIKSDKIISAETSKSSLFDNSFDEFHTQQDKKNSLVGKIIDGNESTYTEKSTKSKNAEKIDFDEIISNTLSVLPAISEDLVIDDFDLNEQKSNSSGEKKFDNADSMNISNEKKISNTEISKNNENSSQNLDLNVYFDRNSEIKLSDADKFEEMRLQYIEIYEKRIQNLENDFFEAQKLINSLSISNNEYKTRETELNRLLIKNENTISTLNNISESQKIKLINLTEINHNQQSNLTRLEFSEQDLKKKVFDLDNLNKINKSFFDEKTLHLEQLICDQKEVINELKKQKNDLQIQQDSFYKDYIIFQSKLEQLEKDYEDKIYDLVENSKNVFEIQTAKILEEKNEIIASLIIEKNLPCQNCKNLQEMVSIIDAEIGKNNVSISNSEENNKNLNSEKEEIYPADDHLNNVQIENKRLKEKLWVAQQHIEHLNNIINQKSKFFGWI